MHEPTPPSQRHSATSQEAAVAIMPAQLTMRERVLWAVREYGPITDESIGDLLDMNPSTVRPRRIELFRSNAITQAGVARTRSDRKAATWVVAPPGGVQETLL